MCDVIQYHTIPTRNERTDCQTNGQAKKGWGNKGKTRVRGKERWRRSHKPDNLSLILGPTVERENRPLKVVHMHTMVLLTPPLTRTETTNTFKKKIAIFVFMQFVSLFTKHFCFHCFGAGDCLGPRAQHTLPLSSSPSPSIKI